MLLARVFYLGHRGVKWVRLASISRERARARSRSRENRLIHGPSHATEVPFLGSLFLPALGASRELAHKRLKKPGGRDDQVIHHEVAWILNGAFL